jgi:polyferredoxin
MNQKWFKVLVVGNIIFLISIVLVLVATIAAYAGIPWLQWLLEPAGLSFVTIHGTVGFMGLLIY